MSRPNLVRVFFIYVFLLSCTCISVAQDTKIMGFIAGESSFEDDQLNFGFGEQDLFITSQLNDHFSFLGETVFKFSPDAPTNFNVSVERVIVGYNYKGNHNVYYGKHHTPVNYWNDTYHHGRVFFPTISRPLLFGANIIPIHTTGISFQGINLGKMRFGYDVMIGNGLGSSEVADNDDSKSITAAINVRPWDTWLFRASLYRDIIAAGAEVHGTTIEEKTDQYLYTATIAHFGEKFEFLAEGTIATNNTNSTPLTSSYASYIYAGIPIGENWIPYIRFDHLEYDSDEQFFNNDDTTSILTGLRYEISYLIVLKLEYQHIDRSISGNADVINAQIAIGF